MAGTRMECLVITIGHGETEEACRLRPIWLDEWQDLVESDDSLAYLNELPLDRAGRPGSSSARWSAVWQDPHGVRVLFRWETDHIGVEIGDREGKRVDLDVATRMKLQGVAARLGAQLHVGKLSWDLEGEEP